MKRIVKNRKYIDHEATAKRVEVEVRDSLNILESINRPIISFFGSHLTPKDHPDYASCLEVASKLAGKGFAIATGGGPAIMHAANKAAFDNNVPSIGFKEKLLMGEQSSSKVFTHVYEFEFMFVRRFALAVKSVGLIFYPGGYGTFNELFEYLTLIQTGIADSVPVILVNSEFWSGLFDWISKQPAKRGLFGNSKEISKIKILDNPEEIIRAICDED